MVTVKILRGVSGSGKSTYAKNMYPGAMVMSSDDFWVLQDLSKTYQENFDPSRLGEAHSWNLRRFIEYLTRIGENKNFNFTVVIDNTNTTVAEIAPYYAVAQAYGADVEVISIDTPPFIAHARNTHGVPKAAHAAQAERFYATNEAFPKYWNHRIIYGNVETIRKGA